MIKNETVAVWTNEDKILTGKIVNDLGNHFLVKSNIDGKPVSFPKTRLVKYCGDCGIIIQRNEDETYRGYSYCYSCYCEIQHEAAESWDFEI